MTVYSELVEHGEIVPHPTVVDERDELAKRIIIRVSAHQALEEHLCRRHEVHIVSHLRDMLEESRKLDQRLRQLLRNLLVLCAEGHLRGRRTSFLRNNREWTIQRCLTQEAHSHQLLAFSNHPLSFDMPGAKTPVRPTRPKLSGPPLGSTMAVESPQTPLPKGTRAIGDEIDDLNKVAAVTEVTEASEPQLDWNIVVSSDHAGSTFMRRPVAREVHLQHLQEHRMYEELDLPGSSRCRCVGWTQTTTARPKRDCQRLRAGPDWAGELLQCDTAAGYVAYTAGRRTIVWAGLGSRGYRSGLPPSTHSRQERCMGHAPVGNCSGTWTSMASAQDPC